MDKRLKYFTKEDTWVGRGAAQQMFDTISH